MIERLTAKIGEAIRKVCKERKVTQVQLAQLSNGIFFEFLRYVVVGGIAFLADFGTMVGFHELVFRQYARGVYAAAVCGFVVGLAVNYFLSLLFVFTKAKDCGKGRSFGAFVAFGVIGLVGLGLTEFGMWIGIECFGWNYMIVKILVTGGVLMWNYLGRKLIIFR